MIVKQYIKDFENYGFGMFVHFGLYSIESKGEWYRSLECADIPKYESLKNRFNPTKNWAKNLVSTAKKSGCKYITLTTRHHDGFSLYDTRGLNDFDAPHSKCKRDLIKEFVDECNSQKIVPFFYHTLLDWHEESYKKDFPGYLEYLRDSVKILCRNYGKIGGFWFDGMWDRPNDNWEEDLLYGMIRKYQPEAMIINNTGLQACGASGHIELDSVTFERGKPKNINTPDSPKYVASEMCQIFGNHWGYAKDDLAYKSVKSIINDLVCCRKYGSNFLLNIGLKGNGQIREIDSAMLGMVGHWVKIFDEAIRKPKQTHIEIENKPDDFILNYDNNYYLFCVDVPMSADPNVAINSNNNFEEKFGFNKKIKSAVWMDDNSEADYLQDGNSVVVHSYPFKYGKSLVVRVLKFKT